MVTKQDLLNGLVSYWDGSFSSLTAIDVHGENDGEDKFNHLSFYDLVPKEEEE